MEEIAVPKNRIRHRNIVVYIGPPRIHVKIEAGMIHIEVIGLEPSCNKCNDLLENTQKAARESGLEAEVEKKWTLSEEIREKYGLLPSPALVIKGVVVDQGKVYKPDRIAGLLRGSWIRPKQPISGR